MIENFDEETFFEILWKFGCNTKNLVGLNYEYLGLLNEDFIGFYIFNIIQKQRKLKTDKNIYLNYTLKQKSKLIKDFFDIS